MKKKWIAAVLCFSVLTTLTGPFVKADDTVQEESILEKYEHQHRDISQSFWQRMPLVITGENITF